MPSQPVKKQVSLPCRLLASWHPLSPCKRVLLRARMVPGKTKDKCAVPEFDWCFEDQRKDAPATAKNQRGPRTLDYTTLHSTRTYILPSRRCWLVEVQLAYRCGAFAWHPDTGAVRKASGGLPMSANGEW